MSVRTASAARLILATAIVLMTSAPLARAADLCVGDAKDCSKTIQAAIDAAHDGDTIRIARGTFAGGVTIDKSVQVKGAGSRATTIRGGGPVVTIGDSSATGQPTVALSGVAITGGVTHGDDVVALGGGIYVPSGAGGAPGATVTITDAVIEGNRAGPTETVSSGNVTCPSGPCPFAFGGGGGIATFGSMTITDSVVRDNVAAGVASDADGGGIASFTGDLTIVATRITGNRAVAVPPNGRYAEGGGVFTADGATSLTVRDSLVRGNVATLTSDLPAFAGNEAIELQAHAGGIQVGNGTPTAIDDTRFIDNVASASDPVGQAVAFDSALLVNDSPLTMSGALVAGNRSMQDSAATADAGPGGSAVELDGGGTITDTWIVNNTSTARSDDGVAGIAGALALLNFNNDARLVTVRDSVIARNTAVASSETGSARALGAGILNDSLLELRGVRVVGNVGAADAPTGVAQGGGVWNSDEISGPPVELSATDTVVSHNVLRGSRGIDVQGGGLFTTFPVTLTNVLITRNSPDQCVGC